MWGTNWVPAPQMEIQTNSHLYVKSRALVMMLSFSFFSPRIRSFPPNYSLNLCLILYFVPMIRQLRPKKNLQKGVLSFWNAKCNGLQCRHLWCLRWEYYGSWGTYNPTSLIWHDWETRRLSYYGGVTYSIVSYDKLDHFVITTRHFIKTHIRYIVTYTK
jgi:hypothetical protein